MPNAVEDFSGNARRSLEDVVAGDGVGFDQHPLLVVQTCRLVQHRERNCGLADIVEHGGCRQPLDVRLGEAEA
jgi:hypothetical protein